MQRGVQRVLQLRYWKKLIVLHNRSHLGHKMWWKCNKLALGTYTIYKYCNKALDLFLDGQNIRSSWLYKTPYVRHILVVAKHFLCIPYACCYSYLTLVAVHIKTASTIISPRLALGTYTIYKYYNKALDLFLDGQNIRSSIFFLMAKT